MASSASLVPASQAAFLPAPEALDFGADAENRQYQHLLSVAGSQECRLKRYTGLRKNLGGYNLKDDWLVTRADIDAPKGVKKPKFDKLTPGVPCLLAGTENNVTVAYLGPAEAAGSAGACNVRVLEGGARQTWPREQLLQLPTRPAQQGDWVLPVDLQGEERRLLGRQGFCGLAGVIRGPPSRDGFWVNFAPTDPSHPPELVLIDVENLVALAGPAAGAHHTPWESSQAALADRPPKIMALADEGAADEQQLALCDDDADDDTSQGSTDLSDSESEDDEEEVKNAIVPGALVKVPLEGGSRYARVEHLKGAGGATVIVRLLDAAPGSSEIAECSKSELAVQDQVQLETAAVCPHCGAAAPDAELLLCENYGMNCLGCAHISCLRPPLKALPEGDWYCERCAGGRRRGRRPLAASKAAISPAGGSGGKVPVSASSAAGARPTGGQGKSGGAKVTSGTSAKATAKATTKLTHKPTAKATAKAKAQTLKSNSKPSAKVKANKK